MAISFVALVGAGGFAVASPSAARAASTTTIAPAADASVESRRARTNFGSAKTLVVDAAPVARSYVRFRVTALPSPVVTATLRLFATAPSTAGYAVRSAGAKSWTERGLTYANAPSASRAYAHSGRIRAAGWTSVNVTPLVRGTGVVNFAITTSGTAALRLASREAGARRPQLIVVSNGAPRAADVAATLDEDAAKPIQLSATDVDGDALRYAIATTPRHGTLSPVADNAVTYTPEANYNGPDSFTFRASDGALNSGLATVALTVRPVNDTPVCGDVALAVSEDVPDSVAPACSDADGDSLVYTIVAQAAKGTASVAGGRLHYAPSANANAADRFTYRANDGTAASHDAAVSVWIAPVNDAPQADNASAATNEDASREIVLSASDVDGDALTYAVTTGPSHGTLSPLSGNTLTYTPEANYNGPDSFTFRASDGTLDSGIATVELTVRPVNDTPVCGDLALAVSEDVPGSVGAACSDVDGDSLAYAVVGAAVKGMASVSGGRLHYAPSPNANAADRFTYRASDGTAASDPAAVSVWIAPVNDAPRAANASTETPEDTPRDIVLSASDVDGDALTYAVTTGPSHGTLSPLSGNTLTYTPAPNYNGADSFGFTASDGNGGSDTGTVSIWVTSVNDSPLAVDDTASTHEDAVLQLAAADVSANDVDVDNDPIVVSAVAPTAETHGTVALEGATITYAPSPNYHGIATFVYTASDGSSSDTGTVFVAVSSVNDAPVCGARSKATPEDTAANGVACADVDGDALSYGDRTGPANGTLALHADGTFTYTPATDYNGADSAGFTASDGNGGSDTGTLSLTVTAVNDPPRAAADRRTLTEDTAVTLNAKGNDAAGPANETGQVLTVTQVTDPARGTAKILTAEDDPTKVNYVRYKPSPNYFGSDSFTYTVCDDGVTNESPDPRCATATVSATVTAVDDAPICHEGAGAEHTTGENAAVSGVACREVDGDAVAYTLTSGVAHGTLDFSAADATFTYTPATDFNGSDSFSYEGCDTSTTALLCDTGTARVMTVRFVTPTVETDPVPNAGDAADDPAIWVDADNPGRSAIIGTDKQGGIAVYDLAGDEIEYRADGRMNNVDLRQGFQLSGRSVTLVAAGNRTDSSIAVYTLDPATRTLAPVAARMITAGFEVYGSCMYRSSTSGKLYYFLTSKEGYVEQWELFDNGFGAVDATRVRTLSVGSQTEGCVADDELGHLYLAEENVGIWKYAAAPDGGTSRVLVDTTGPAGHLVADVEGLTIVYGASGTGYLLASSQGNDSYVVYRREAANAFVRVVKVEAANGIDAVEDTDGIDVTTADLGPAFPDGLFVVQDGVNAPDNQNYKLVPLGSILGDSP